MYEITYNIKYNTNYSIPYNIIRSITSALPAMYLPDTCHIDDKQRVEGEEVRVGWASMRAHPKQHANVFAGCFQSIK